MNFRSVRVAAAVFVIALATAPMGAHANPGTLPAQDPTYRITVNAYDPTDGTLYPGGCYRIHDGTGQWAYEACDGDDGTQDGATVFTVPTSVSGWLMAEETSTPPGALPGIPGTQYVGPDGLVSIPVYYAALRSGGVSVTLTPTTPSADYANGPAVSSSRGPIPPTRPSPST